MRQRLIEFCQENALVIAIPSSKHTRQDSTHGHHQMVNTEIKLIVFFAAKCGEPLYKSFVLSTKTRRGPDRGSDHELLIAKFRLKLKKVRKNH